MTRTKSLPRVAALVATLAIPCSALADADGILTPISLGAIGNRELQASTIGFGIGPAEDRVHVLFHGRAMVSPALSIGVGGVKGGYAFVEREHVHFGIELGVSAGSGRYRKQRVGLLAAAEPGLFLRVVSEKIGAVHIDAAWHQPVYVHRGGLAGAAMLSIAWSPFFGK